MVKPCRSTANSLRTDALRNMGIPYQGASVGGSAKSWTYSVRMIDWGVHQGTLAFSPTHPYHLLTYCMSQLFCPKHIRITPGRCDVASGIHVQHWLGLYFPGAPDTTEKESGDGGVLMDQDGT
jgi:hypothetical protein